MERFSLIPDKDFKIISKTVKELRKLYYEKKDIKVDMLTLLFSRIDELLEKYSNALNQNANEETFTVIKSGLMENCYLLNVALQINEINEIKQIEHKPISRYELLYDEGFLFYESLFRKKYDVHGEG